MKDPKQPVRKNLEAKQFETKVSLIIQGLIVSAVIAVFLIAIFGG